MVPRAWHITCIIEAKIVVQFSVSEQIFTTYSLLDNQITRTIQRNNHLTIDLAVNLSVKYFGFIVNQDKATETERGFTITHY